MNIKALTEKKNELVAEYRSLIDTAKIENRDLKGDTKEAELAAEIATLNTQIKSEENRAAAEADSIEKINSQEEKREMDNKLTQEVEVRGVEQFIRKQSNGTELGEVRAVTTDAGAGALTVPTHLHSKITKRLEEFAPIFSRTQNFTPVNGFLELLRESANGEAGFVGEMDDLTETSFNFKKVRLDQKRAGTFIQLSKHIINDSGIQIANYAVNQLGKQLGKTLDKSVLVGNPVSEFEGVLTVVAVDSKPEEFETEGVGAITSDDLLDVYNNLNQAYVDGAIWVMNRVTFNAVAKLRDGNGNYLLIRDVVNAGAPYKLFGQPLFINNHVPAMATGAKSVVFANFSEGYATMTKTGYNLQHVAGDTAQALKGAELLVLDTYVDGKILQPDAIKILKIK